MITITTHPMPDTDAICSVLGLAWMLDQSYEARFEARPDLETWHRPDLGRFVVDVGGSPLDHHIILPDGGSRADRSTCAFRLCAEYVATIGTPAERMRAHALLERVIPAVERQDTTGSITAPRDPIANIFGIPGIVERVVWQSASDHAALAALEPLFLSLFAQELTRWQAENAPAYILSQLGNVVRVGLVIGYERTGLVGEAISDELFRTALLRMYPDIKLFVSYISWYRNSELLAYSRGVGAGRGSGINVQALIAQIEPTLPDAIRQEVAHWHRENWWCGLGGVKVPNLTRPPEGLVETLVEYLGALL